MKALVLGGGGARGAWQVGVLRYLYLEERNSYSIISGSSVGALNGSFLYQYERGAEVEAYVSLEKLWFSLKNKDVYKRWYWGLLGRLPAAWKSSLYDNSPLRNLVSNNISWNKGIDKILSIGATDLESGCYLSWNSLEEDFQENIVDYIVASSAVPGYFPPCKIGDRYFGDAGIRELVPVRDAILLGATELDIVIPSVKQKDRPPKRTLQVVMRAISIMMHEIDVNDIQIPCLDDLQVRIIRPISDIHEDVLSFNSSKIRNNIQAGYNDAMETWGKTS